MKKQHPIRKMQQAEMDVWAGRGGGKASSLADLNNQSMRVLARHVKPLLDALDTFGHSSFHHDYSDLRSCEVCRLLAEWKAKL